MDTIGFVEFSLALKGVRVKFIIWSFKYLKEYKNSEQTAKNTLIARVKGYGLLQKVTGFVAKNATIIYLKTNFYELLRTNFKITAIKGVAKKC